MKCDAEELGLESVAERVQATTACGRRETGKLRLERRAFVRSPSGYGVIRSMATAWEVSACAR
jgi:hypothetical protein